MKICVLTVAPVPDEYSPVMTEHFRAQYGDLVRPDTELTLRGTAAGPAPDPENLPDYRNAYFSLLLKQELVKAALRAEDDGFDAVVINCFDDPAVLEARAVLNIPVFGICEPSLHFTAQLGRYFGALVPDLPGQISVVEQQIREHGLWSRLVENGVQKDPMPFSDAQPEANKDPNLMVERLRPLAEELVNRGADAILMACGGVGDAVYRAGVHSLEINGRQVPVVTPLAVALKHAEACLDLTNTLALPLSSEAHDSRRLNAEDKARIQQGFGQN